MADIHVYLISCLFVSLRSKTKASMSRYFLEFQLLIIQYLASQILNISNDYCYAIACQVTCHDIS